MHDDANTTGSTQRGGILSLSYATALESLDPAVAWDLADTAVLRPVYQGLFRYAARPGTAGTVLEPCLAEALPGPNNGGISGDGLTYTIRLREGVRFQAPVEREIEAADFKYSFERMMDARATPRAPATYFYSGVLGADTFRAGKAREIAGVEVVDKRTLRIRLDRPDASFLHLLSLPFCSLVAREWVDQTGADFGRRPLGTGPFQFQSWIPMREIVLTRNPRYWEPGRPHLDALRYDLAFSPETALAMLEQGELDVLGDGVPPAMVDDVTRDPRWTGCLHRQPQIASQHLFLNVRMKPLDDVRVRRAIAWAIDRERLAADLGGQPLYQFFPAGLPGHQIGRRFCGNDVARARALLAEAGHATGFDLQIYTDGVEPGPMVIAHVAKDLARVGIRATPSTLTNNSFLRLQATPRALQSGLYGWWLDYPDPYNWVGPLLGSPESASAYINSSFWWTPTLQAMVDQAQATGNAQQRLARFARIQEHVMDAMPYVPLFTPGRVLMHSPRVRGFYAHPVHEVDPTTFSVA